MKTPHLATAVIAASMINGPQGLAMEYKLEPSPQMDDCGNTWSQGARKRRTMTSQPSQKQIRKNRRRAHAAGKKNAFQ